MKKTIFLCLFTLMMLNKFSAQTQMPELVYIRIQEPTKLTGSANDAVMVIIKPDNTSETIELKRLELGGEYS